MHKLQSRSVLKVRAAVMQGASPDPRHAAHLFKLHGHVRSLYAPHYQPLENHRLRRVCKRSLLPFHFLRLFIAASRLFSHQTCTKFITPRKAIFFFFFLTFAHEIYSCEKCLALDPGIDSRLIREHEYLITLTKHLRHAHR